MFQEDHSGSSVESALEESRLQTGRPVRDVATVQGEAERALGSCRENGKQGEVMRFRTSFVGW